MTAVPYALAALACLIAISGASAPDGSSPKRDGAPAKGQEARGIPSTPNFVFIQAEAQGWSSTSVDMDGEPPSSSRPAGLTPNLEQLAKDGTKAGHRDSPVAAPLRLDAKIGAARGLHIPAVRNAGLHDPRAHASLAS